MVSRSDIRQVDRSHRYNRMEMDNHLRLCNCGACTSLQHNLSRADNPRRSHIDLADIPPARRKRSLVHSCWMIRMPADRYSAHPDIAHPAGIGRHLDTPQYRRIDHCHTETPVNNRKNQRTPRRANKSHLYRQALQGTLPDRCRRTVCIHQTRIEGSTGNRNHQHTHSERHIGCLNSEIQNHNHHW